MYFAYVALHGNQIEIKGFVGNFIFFVFIMQLISLYTCNFIASEYKDRIWKNIRDNYVRALSGKKSGSAVDEIPQYPYLDAMSFLKPYVNIRAKNAESNFQPSQVRY